jgi:hypothetical protein
MNYEERSNADLDSTKRNKLLLVICDQFIDVLRGIPTSTPRIGLGIAFPLGMSAAAGR